MKDDEIKKKKIDKPQKENVNLQIKREREKAQLVRVERQELESKFLRWEEIFVSSGYQVTPKQPQFPYQ